MDVRSFERDKIQITAAEVDVPGVSVAVSAKEEGKRFLLEVTLGTEVPKGRLDGKITLRTTSASKPVVEVPLRATVI
jgi:hypothetical protein